VTPFCAWFRAGVEQEQSDDLVTFTDDEPDEQPRRGRRPQAPTQNDDQAIRPET
jgi:hypothetical protein